MYYVIVKCFATSRKRKILSSDLYNLDIDSDKFKYWPFEPVHEHDFKKLKYYGTIMENENGRKMMLNYILFMSESQERVNELFDRGGASLGNPKRLSFFSDTSIDMTLFEASVAAAAQVQVATARKEVALENGEKIVAQVVKKQNADKAACVRSEIKMKDKNSDKPHTSIKKSSKSSNPTVTKVKETCKADDKKKRKGEAEKTGAKKKVTQELDDRIVCAAIRKSEEQKSVKKNKNDGDDKDRPPIIDTIVDNHSSSVTDIAETMNITSDGLENSTTTMVVQVKGNCHALPDGKKVHEIITGDPPHKKQKTENCPSCEDLRDKLSFAVDSLKAVEEDRNKLKEALGDAEKQLENTEELEKKLDEAFQKIKRLKIKKSALEALVQARSSKDSDSDSDGVPKCKLSKLDAKRKEVMLDCGAGILISKSKIYDVEVFNETFSSRVNALKKLFWKDKPVQLTETEEGVHVIPCVNVTKMAEILNAMTWDEKDLERAYNIAFKRSKKKITWVKEKPISDQLLRYQLRKVTKYGKSARTKPTSDVPVQFEGGQRGKPKKNKTAKAPVRAEKESSTDEGEDEQNGEKGKQEGSEEEGEDGMVGDSEEDGENELEGGKKEVAEEEEDEVKGGKGEERELESESELLAESPVKKL